MIESFSEDLRDAIRSALKRPGFALVAIFNLAIGIGVNTAVFRVVNAVLIRQPGYTEPAGLVRVRERFPRIGEISFGVSQAEYLDYRDRTRVFTSIAGYEDVVFDLTGCPEPVRIRAVRATHTLFATLGVAPVVGRTFTESEDQYGSSRVVVLSYALWRQKFGAASRFWDPPSRSTNSRIP